MPLFTTISGYVYALRPVRVDAVAKFLRGKARRLLLPLVTVSTIHYLLRLITPGTNLAVPEPWWRIYFFSFDHFWFLQALLLIFLLVTVLEVLELIDRPRNTAIVLLILIVLAIIRPASTTFFSLNSSFRLAPFFILGLGFYRFGDCVLTRDRVWLAWTMAIVGVLAQQLVWFNVVELTARLALVTSILTGVAGVALLFHYRRAVGPLAWLGRYAYGIYLFHVWATAGSRIMLQRLGVEANAALFPVALLAGLAVPVLMELVIRRSVLLRRALLGLR